MNKNFTVIDGNAAASYVAYAFNEVVVLYPITPASPMGEMVDEWAARGKKNIFGDKLKVVETVDDLGLRLDYVFDFEANETVWDRVEIDEARLVVVGSREDEFVLNKLEQLKKNDNFGIIAPQFLNSDGSIQPSCRRFPKHRDLLYTSLGLATILKKSPQFNHWKMGDFDHNSARFVDQPQGAFLLTQQKAVQQVGLLDELFPMFFSDVDWCRRFTEKGWKIFFYPNVQIVHHKGTSIYKNRLKMIWSSHQSFYRYFKKYYPGCRWRLVNFFTKIYLMLLAIIRSLVYLTVKNKFK